MRRLVAMAALVLASGAAVAQPAGPAVYAAGSLREALTEVAALWTARGQPAPVLTFGASGLLRQRIEGGEPAEVFASADTGHPQALAARGGWQPPVVFARNLLCALAQPALALTPQSLLDTLLRADVRVGTSTPKADPAGDYAFTLFRRAEALQPGATARLEAKALQLTGGPGTPQAPAGRGTYAWLMDSGQADVFLTYCTNAVAAQREVPRLQVVAIPPELQVGADYGLTVREGAPESARSFAAFVRSAPAQAVLQRLGFGTP